MASISGSVTIAGDPDDWIACAFDADTHAFAGVAAVAAGTYEITGLTAGRAYVVSCRPKTGGVWQAQYDLYSAGDYVLASDTASSPYLFKATAAESGDTDWNSVTLSMSCDGINDSTDFSQADAKAHSISGSGDVKFSTAEKKYGTASLALDGSGDYLTIADSADWSLSTSQSMTFECWFYLTSASVNRTIFTITAGGGAWGRLIIQTTGPKAWFVFGVSWSIVHNTIVTLDAWHHVAIVRDESTWTLYLDGVASGTNTANNSVDPSSITIGRNPRDTSEDFAGYLDAIRLTKGVARYTSAFTPPTADFVQGLGVPTESTEPTWPTTPGNTVVDGGVTWTNMGRMVQPLMQGPLIAA